MANVLRVRNMLTGRVREVQLPGSAPVKKPKAKSKAKGKPALESGVSPIGDESKL